MSTTEKLLKLYRVQQQLQSLRSRVDQAERYLGAQERQLRELQTQRDSLESQRRQLNAVAHNLEVEAQTADQRIEKLREQMNSAQNNKEYTALRTELSTVKIEKDKLESSALERMGEVDSLDTELAQIKATVAEREKIREVARRQLDERRGEIAQRLAELEIERSAAAAEAPPEALVEFEQLVGWHEGEAMAEIVETNRRRMEYSCGACNMALPIEKLSALLSSGALTKCTSCGRILFIGEEIREQFVSSR